MAGISKEPSEIFEYLLRIPHYTIVITINIRLYCQNSLLRVKVVSIIVENLDRTKFACLAI